MNLIAAASAPGKVVLSGEYAVLDGAPAVCMAVNRRARATVRKIAGTVSRVESPGFSDVVGRFQMTEDGVKWLTDTQVFEIVDAVLRAAYERMDSSLEITLNTEQFIDVESKSKIGIGSSAALTAALCAAIAGSVDVREAAQSAHRLLQREMGSGVDVACSLSGGLISYRMEGGDVAALKWPDGLQFRLIGTGIASSTVDKLALLDSISAKTSRTGLAAAAESMAATWERGDSEEILKNYTDYIEQLHSFSIDHKLGIFEAGHDSLLGAARAKKLVFKPCGAGGGDVGIVLGSNGAELDAFVAALPSNFSLVDCALDHEGIKLEETTLQ